MMLSVELGFAVLALLLTPGPTNSLMLLAGAERGLAGSVRLIPAELAGYFLSILPLSLIGAAYLADNGALRAVVTVAAGLWIAALAVRLWRAPGVDATGPSVGAREVFVTTALNPKALIFGLVLLPSPDRLVTNLALFAALVILVAVIWATVGAALRVQRTGQPRALFLLRRLASVWLAVISVILLVRGAGA